MPQIEFDILKLVISECLVLNSHTPFFLEVLKCFCSKKIAYLYTLLYSSLFNWWYLTFQPASTVKLNYPALSDNVSMFKKKSKSVKFV